MNANTIKARELLVNGAYTCVFCRGETVYTCKERGIIPLLAHVDAQTDLKGFSAADKVVGKAAALLYVLLGVTEINAQVLSDGAAAILNRYHIAFCAETQTAAIRNRAGTGYCPMEEAVRDMDTPTEALPAIRARLKQLHKTPPAAADR